MGQSISSPLWDEAAWDVHVDMAISVPVEICRGFCGSTMPEQETELSLLVLEAAGEICVCILARIISLSAANRKH